MYEADQVLIVFEANFYIVVFVLLAILLDMWDHLTMGHVVDFKREIKRLEDMKWDILLAKGQDRASYLWIPLDHKLKVLYSWWVNELYSEGRENELPFHLRRRE